MSVSMRSSHDSARFRRISRSRNELSEYLVPNGSHMADADPARDQQSLDHHRRSSWDQSSSTVLNDSDEDTERAKSTRIREEDGTSFQTAKAPLKEDKRPVAWSDLPRKSQLFYLALTRLAEPIVMTNLSSYMFFMLRSFDPSLSDSAVSAQAGLLTGSFTGAQCLTAVVWGNMADRPWMGRKRVIILGLTGTLISSVGFGFARSFAAAVFFRALGGALNGNVGVMRTMISEIVREKKYLSKAFLLLPATFNVGILLGPLLGGWLQNPVQTFPNTFGPGSRLGGADGVQWMIKYPYALPNLLNALLLTISILLVVFGLEETHFERKHLPDPGLQMGQKILAAIFRKPRDYRYQQIKPDEDNEDIELSTRTERAPKPKEIQVSRQKLPLRRIFRRNVVATFLTHGLLTGHLGAFQNLWFLFLSTPRFDPADPQPPDMLQQKPPFHFTGGLGLPPASIGGAIGIIGGLGLLLQFGAYSQITHKYGVIRTYRASLVILPVAYIIAPYLAVMPTSSPAPNPADGFLLWFGVFSLLCIIVLGRTFASPCTQILVNNCSPHPSVLSTIHGIGQSVASGTRTLGPIVFSSIYGRGLKVGMVGFAWWALAAQALVAFAVSWLQYEGSGHEIRLEGE